MFRRRKKAAEQDSADLVDGASDLPEDDQPDDEAAAEEPVVPERPQGPWDVDDVPDDELNRVDLGGLRVPIPPDVEVRVDVNGEGEVVAATLVKGQSAMQVNVFAAPKRSGIWAEVRQEIAEALKGAGGQAVETDGRYGTELRAAVPVQGGGAAPARFLGVDGPRWFVRAMITGPAAQDLVAAEPLEAALRDVVVVRGGDAMAVRDPLPLRLPREVTDQAAAQAAAAQAADGDPLALPERGPEITEVR